MKALPALCLAASILCCGAAEFRNLVNNPGLRFGADGRPYDWDHDSSASIRFKKDKDGSNIAELLPNEKAVTFRQLDLQLKVGGKYRIGAMIRTKGFKAARSGVIVYNYAWGKGVGSPRLPADTNGWKTVEADITAPASRYSTFTVCAYTVGHSQGTFEVKSIWLRALDAESDKIAVPSPSVASLNRLSPVSPRLDDVDPQNAKMLFAFNYRLDKPEKEYFCRASIKKSNAVKYESSKNFPLIDKLVQTSFGRIGAGEWTVKAELVERASGKIVASNEYSFTTRKSIRISNKPERRLNSLVTRLLTANAGNREYSFSVPRDSWVFIHLEKGARGTKAYLDRDAAPAIIHRAGEAYETMRKVAAGDHAVRIENASGGRLIINSIPEILAYSYPSPYPKHSGFEYYHGPFMIKYLFPVITTFNHGYGIGSLPGGAYDDLTARGKQWFCLGLFNQKLPYYQTPDEITAYLKKRLADAKIHGLAFDEITSYWKRNKLVFTDVLWRIRDLEKPVYTWSAGYTYANDGLNADFLSALSNSSRGKGALLLEYYARSDENEAKAAAQIESAQNGSLKRIEALKPGITEQTFFILGGYTKPGGYLKHVYPQSDVKKFWDMYFRNLATGKDFETLRGIGIYAFNNGTEESIRWLARIIRHYAVEGASYSLADKYGYKYLPGHVSNCDFENGLKYWKADPAGKNSIRAGKKIKYGQTIQKRQGKPDTVGDAYCVFTRSDKAPNRLSQTMKGFAPGKLYVLRFVVADEAEVAAKKATGSIFAFNASLNGAEVVTEKSPAAKYGKTIEVSRNKYLNTHTVVFKALKPEIELVFKDWASDRIAGGRGGQKLALNYIQVTPYYTE